MMNDSLRPGWVTLGIVATPIGPFGAVLSPRGLCRLGTPPEPPAARDAWIERWLPGARPIPDPRALAAVGEQLSAYFEGALRAFALPLDLRGTPFQTRVWQALRDIPYGQTRTYAEVAAAIGAPTSVRAVGAANGANPIMIVVPCHRVIGSRGALTGYGGGLDMKFRLLRREGVLMGRLLPARLTVRRPESRAAAVDG